MSKSKHLVLVIFSMVVYSLLSFLQPLKALETYSASDIATHNTPEDCWMSFESSVYDLTSYIKSHDKYMDIRDWCGKDMTQDFQDKAGMGVDHKESTYSLLAAYQIGTLSNPVVLTTVSVSSVPVTTEEVHTEDEEYSVELEGDVMKTLSIEAIAHLWGIDAEQLLAQIIETYNFKGSYTVETILDEMRTEYKFSPSQIKDIAEGIKTGSAATVAVPNLASDASNTEITAIKPATNPYQFALPFIATLLIYLGSYFFSTTAFGSKVLPRAKFNLIWNSIMIISLIPSVLFGFYLIFRYSIPELAKVDFDFLYWHVEGSIVMGTLVFAHLILRFKQYLAQVRFGFAAKV